MLEYHWTHWVCWPYHIHPLAACSVWRHTLVSLHSDTSGPASTPFPCLSGNKRKQLENGKQDHIHMYYTHTHTSSTLRPSHTQENCVKHENISWRKHSQTCTPSYLTCTCQCLKRGDDRQIIGLVWIVQQFEVRQVKTWTSSDRQRERGGEEGSH